MCFVNTLHSDCPLISAISMGNGSFNIAVLYDLRPHLILETCFKLSTAPVAVSLTKYLHHFQPSKKARSWPECVTRRLPVALKVPAWTCLDRTLASFVLLGLSLSCWCLSLLTFCVPKWRPIWLVFRSCAVPDWHKDARLTPLIPLPLLRNSKLFIHQSVRGFLCGRGQLLSGRASLALLRTQSWLCYLSDGWWYLWWLLLLSKVGFQTVTYASLETLLVNEYLKVESIKINNSQYCEADFHAHKKTRTNPSSYASTFIFVNFNLIVLGNLSEIPFVLSRLIFTDSVKLFRTLMI